MQGLQALSSNSIWPGYIDGLRRDGMKCGSLKQRVLRDGENGGLSWSAQIKITRETNVNMMLLKLPELYLATKHPQVFEEELVEILFLFF